MKKLISAIFLCFVAALGLQAQVPCSPVRVTAMEETLLVRNLSTSDFALKVHGKPVQITSAKFSAGNRLVLVLDSSGSMSGPTSIDSHRRNWLLLVQLAETIVSTAPKNHAIGMITFGDTVRQSVPPSGSREPLHDALERERQYPRTPFGMSAVWDAVHEAIGMLEPVQDGDFILVISDGGDNNSKVSWQKLRSEVLAKRIRVLPIISLLSAPRTPEERKGWLEMQSLAQSSGGLVFSLDPKAWASRPTAEASEFLASLARSVMAVAAYSYGLRLDVPNLDKKEKLRIELVGEQRRRKKLKLFYPPEIGPCTNDIAPR